MSWIWLIPFAAQGALMGADELWCHRRRGLPRWERVGHPVDTASVLFCMSLPWLLSLGPGAIRVYMLASLGSCLLVTKDEPVHAQRCAPLEHWLHALLFVLHPLVLGVTALLWLARENHPLIPTLEELVALPLPDPSLAAAFLSVQLVLVALFLVYQSAYWWRWTP